MIIMMTAVFIIIVSIIPLHGSILEASIWLLAGSTRFVHHSEVFGNCLRCTLLLVCSQSSAQIACQRVDVIKTVPLRGYQCEMNI